MELILLPKLAKNKNKNYVTTSTIHTERNTIKYRIVKYYKGFNDNGHLQFKEIIKCTIIQIPTVKSD